MKLLFCLALIVCLSACSTTDQKIEDMLSRGASVVELSEKDPFNIVGTYRDLDTEFRFDLERRPDAVEWGLTNNTDDLLIHALWTQSAMRLRIYDEETVIYRQNPFEPKLTPSASAALQRLAASPTYKALPKLSRALAMLGVTGRRYPASQPIHHAALVSAELNGPIVPRPGNSGDKTPYMYANPYASHPVKIAVDNFDIVDDLFDCKSTDGPLAIEAMEIAKRDACSVGDCSIESDPNGDDCLGMCGRECDCWEWVCGHCCSTWVCRAHDSLVEDCFESGLTGSELLSCGPAVASTVAIPYFEIFSFGLFSCGTLGLPFDGW